MECREFVDRIGEFVDPGNDLDALAEHAEGCPDCARNLARATALARAIEDLPRVRIPNDLDRKIREAAFPRRTSWPRSFVRVAAALLLLTSLGVAMYDLLGSGYRPLDLRFVDDDTNGTQDEDLALEHIFGPPGAPVATGGPDDR